jgi:O-antigen ligase
MNIVNKYLYLNKMLYYLFSFETAFILFIFAGRFKADPRFEWVPIDITAFFFLISVITGIYILLLKRKVKIKEKSLIISVGYIVFVLYAFLSLIWSPGVVYANQKVFYMATLVLWSLMGASMIIAQDRDRIKRFFIVFIIFAFWVAIESAKTYINHGVGFLTALGGNYLGIGRVIGAGALIVLIYSIFWAKNNWIKFFSLSIFGCFMWILFVAGGRGPLISTYLACLGPISVGWRFDFNNSLRIKKYAIFGGIIIFILIIIVLALYVSGSLTLTIKRMFVLFEEGHGASAGARIAYYNNAYNYWAKKPILGYGIGAWPIINSAVDVRGYPHNIILEIMVELGLVGLIIFVSLLIIALKYFGPWRTIRDDPLKILIFVIFINALANAMVSGDIPDNRFLFFTLGMMTSNTQIINKRR